MWKDLTLKEKAEIMKMSVANGVTDINDIRKLYNESIHADGGHLYRDGGRPNWSHDPASMIEHFEGFRESPYRDGTAWSVGYGQYMKGYGANLDWNALLSGRKKLSRSEAHQQVLRTVEDLKRQLRRVLGDKLYNSLTPGQLMGYLDTGYQRPASMIQAAQVHRTKGAEAAASVLGVNGFADRNAARRAAFTGNWNNYKPTGNANQHIPNMSTGADYNRQMLNNFESPAFQPIALNSPNTSSVWMDYVSKIGQQSPLTFNTPIGTNSVLANNNSISLEPVDFSVIRNSDPLSLDSYASKNNVEYGLGLEGNALWNSPYMLFNEHSAANGGHLFYPGGFKDEFTNKYLGIGQFPDYDSDFIATNNLQYLPYSQLNMMGHDPENIRIGNQGNQTMRVYDDKDATYLADANGNLVTSPLLRQMTQDYVKEHYGPMLQKAFLSNPDKYWDEYNKYRTSSITFDKNGNPVSSGLPPVEKPIKPAAPEFWLLSAGASKAPSALNSVVSPLFNMAAVDNVINDVTPYSSWGNMMSQNAGGPEWAWDLMHPAFSKDILNLTKAAASTAVSKIPEASRNLLASTAINYGAKTRSLPTNIYKSRNLFINGPEGKFIRDSDPFVEFINSKRGVPFNTSFFLRTPRDTNILKLRNGRYKAKAEGNVIIPSGSVDGKFVSYGEPWMEFGTNDLAAWYEFPTSMQRGGRGPHIMATDWRGNQMDYDVTEAWRNMMLRQDPKFIAEEKAMYENLRAQKFNSSQERVQAHKAARKEFYEKWGYNPDINLEIYYGNQTVIPSNRWNFNSEYPRGFLSQPFWRYTQDPYSGAVQKELMMNWESPMKALDKTHADIIPFIDSETGTWDYLTDFRTSNNAQLDVDNILSNLDKIYKRFEESQEKFKAAQHEALRNAEEKVFDYLGSEKHVQRIMESGVSREQAEAIARDMRSNAMATKGNIGYTRTPDAIGEYDAKWEPSHKGRFRSVFGNNKSSFAPEYTTSPVSPEDIYNNVLHELGGHGATMGYSPTKYINDFDDEVLGLKAQAMYELDMERWSPHYKDVYENNSKLKPVRKAEYKDSKDPHIEYLEKVDEYSARARAHNIDPSVDREDVAELYKYFTKESVDKLLKGVWSLLPAGIGLEAIKSKSK